MSKTFLLYSFIVGHSHYLCRYLYIISDFASVGNWVYLEGFGSHLLKSAFLLRVWISKSVCSYVFVGNVLVYEPIS